MTDSSSESVSGAVLIRVAPLERRDTIERRISAFQHASVAGWLGGAVRDVLRLADPELLAWRINCERLPLEAIGVLHGMLCHLVAVEEAAASFSVLRESNHANLLLEQYPRPEAISAPFPLVHRESSGIAPPMSVVIALQQAVPVGVRHQLYTALEVWAELLNGGYPAEDDPIGASGIAAVSITFANPRMVVLATDGCRFGEAAIGPLIRLLVQWHRRYTIEYVSIE